MKELTLIGRAERVDLPKLGLVGVPAKVDTGADVSSIWATGSLELDGKLSVVFFGATSSFYDGVIHRFSKSNFSTTRVANSFGHREIRYKINLKIRVGGRLINGSFSLADRQNKLYPILIGRSLLNKKFLVDVSKGDPLIEEERARRKKFRQQTSELIDKEIS